MKLFEKFERGCEEFNGMWNTIGGCLEVMSFNKKLRIMIKNSNKVH